MIMQTTPVTIRDRAAPLNLIFLPLDYSFTKHPWSFGFYETYKSPVLKEPGPETNKAALT